MTEVDGRGSRAGAELRVERALRAAARAGNRLLSGGVAGVRVGGDGDREVLLTALARMGVRLEGASGLPAEFVFVDHLGDDGGGGRSHPAEPAGDAGRGSGAGLDPVVVALDGGIASARGSDAAARIAWAARGMRTTARLAEEFARARAGARGPRIGVSLVLEPKTAALALALADAGCEVALFSAVSETDPEVAAALAADGRIAVFAPTSAAGAGEERPEAAARLDAEHAAAILDWGPEYLVDDGSHLIRLAHSERPRALDRLRAAAEETTSGVRPLREMEAEGALRIPVIAVNDARTKTDFDNLIGTGQSCVLAIADLLDEAGWAASQRGGADPRPHASAYAGVAGTRWAVVGYGPVGAGTARFAAALGAEVTVVERDPVRALAALHDGFEARCADEALPAADVVVSATGVWHTLDANGFALLRPGTAVAVAGGIDDELALDELQAAGWARRPAGDGLAEWIAPGADHGPLVLADGGGVNYTAAEGNPVEVMDLSFATQLAALTRLMRDDLAPGVHALSSEDEARVARAALEVRGGSADPVPSRGRPGGAAQPWPVHRYRSASA